MNPTDHFAAMYREEAGERLGELEATLLELETSPTDLELVGKAFRAMHTIKGSGAMFGFDDVARFTHELETVFDLVRNGALKVTPSLIGQALQGKDAIRAMLAGRADEGAEDRRVLVDALRALVPKAEAVGAGAAERAAEEPATKVFRVHFRPAPTLLQNGTNPLGLLAELRGLGACELVGHADDVPALEDLDPEQSYLSWDAVLTTDRPANAVRDVFIFVAGLCELDVTVVDDGQHHADDASYKMLGEILMDRGHLTSDQLQATLSAKPKLGELLVAQGLVPAGAVQAAALEQKVVREVRAKRDASATAGSGEDTSSIRVPARKLDFMVDLVGELVIAQARLSQIAMGREDAELLNVAEVMERLSANLRDNTLNIRMVPIGTTFGRFKRLVRDLSSELGKDIELVTDGAETELDKTVIDRLGDPLVHLIRNCCDHGLESPEQRAAKLKPARGTVRLSAYYSGPSVFIEIKDDGRGLDLAAIRAKAVQKGLIAADAKLSDKELYNLVFLPGFSTAAKVSSVSGRGVGMDVVKRSIDALRGSVELTSEPGVGTTVKLKLPLTLAIIEGLLVAVGEARYVLPMSLVTECVELTREDVERSNGNQYASVRGELVSYVRLRDWFGVEGERPPIEQIAIANTDGQRFGFVVDHVVGQHQTVIKTLGHTFRDVQGLSGATILGNGTVALIVDLPTIVHAATAATVH